LHRLSHEGTLRGSRNGGRVCEATRWMLGASIHRAERSAFWRDARPTSRFSGAGLLAAKRRRGRCRAECGQALAAVHTPGGAGVGRLRFPPPGSGVDQLRQGFPRSGAGCSGTCAQRPIVERRAPMFDPKVAGSLRAARRSAVPCGSAAAALPPGSQRAGRKGFGPWRRRLRRPLRAVGADDVLPCFRSSVSLV